MKPANLMLYHGLPILILLFPFLWVGMVGNDHMLKGESGFTELSTVLFLFIAIGFCISSMTLTRRLGMSGFNKAWLLLLIAGATYFALEELSYGQHIFGWGTPEVLNTLNDQQETNLHNVHALFDQVPRALLTLGILVGGVILPLYRTFRSRPLREDARFYWQWPTMDCVTVGLLVILFRPIFTIIETDVISTGENKEQFFALFIMLYCLSLHARLRSRAGSEGASTGGGA
jgi:hypothetical protein